MAGAVDLLTLDGPAGAGKTTIGRRLAASLGWASLDSGLCYRLASWLARRRPLGDDFGLLLAAEGISFDGRRAVRAAGDMEGLLRTSGADREASIVAQDPAVRAALRSFFRSFAAACPAPGLVAEGRDMGTVVFPEAGHKVFLDADPAVRRRRRAAQRGVDDPAMATRDARDRERAEAPLKPAPDALLLDTTERTAAETAEEILAYVQA
ncbi:(d)CMP kinase [bacterium]|nr:(d)CMP kinase [bacterium]